MHIYNQNSSLLHEISDNSIDAIVTDPPYGISLEKWDVLPEKTIWENCFRVLKPGGFLLCFSSIRTQHLLTQHIIDVGFDIKDVLLWIYLNGRVPAMNIDEKIDNALGNKREVIGHYEYIQGSPNSHKKNTYKAKVAKTAPTCDSLAWVGFGLGLKTAYEPILMLQKPYMGNLANNLLNFGTGAVNIDETRIAFDINERKPGQNAHPDGRVMSNIIQTEAFGDYQKFFFVGKVRDGKKTGNIHPTAKPLELMQCLIKLVSKPEDTILDPFMGSGSTGVAAIELNRNFIGYELKKEYFEIAQKRINDVK